MPYKIEVELNTQTYIYTSAYQSDDKYISDERLEIRVHKELHKSIGK